MVSQEATDLGLVGENDRMREALEDIEELTHMLPPEDRAVREIHDAARKGLGTTDDSPSVEAVAATVLDVIATATSKNGMKRSEIAARIAFTEVVVLDDALEHLDINRLIDTPRPGFYRRRPPAPETQTAMEV